VRTGESIFPSGGSERICIEQAAIAEEFDITNPYGRAMAPMANVFAELEWAMIYEGTRTLPPDLALCQRLLQRGDTIRRDLGVRQFQSA
jgi:hypothetical protein